jgi:hypothetical protein
MSHHGTYGSPWDLHTTRMPMIHHGACAQLGCRWLPIGLKLNSNTDGSPWDLHSVNSDANDSSRDINSTWMPMALYRTFTQHGCRWLTMGLTLNSDANVSSRDLWFTMGLTHYLDANDSSRDLRTTWMPMAPHRTYTQLEYRWLTMGLTLSQLGCQ